MNRFKSVGTALATSLLLLCIGSPGALADHASVGCRDPKGCIKINPGNPIRIATIQTLSGPNEFFGLELQQSVEVAAAVRGYVVAGHPIGLSFFDDQCSGDGGEAAAEAIADENRILAVVGTTCSGAALTAAPILTGEAIIMGSSSNTANVLTTFGHDYFRVVPPDSEQAAVAARFALEVLGATTAVTIRAENILYAEGLEQGFLDEFTGTVFDRHVATAGQDLTDVVDALASNVPEVLFAATGPAISIPLIQAIREIEALDDMIFMSGDASLTNGFRETGVAEGAFLTGPQTNFESDAYDEFVAIYSEMFPDTPLATPYHAHSIDVANLIFDAIETVAFTDKHGRLVIRKGAFQTTILATENYEGLSGTITCQPNGECATGAFVVFQVQDGEFVPIPFE
ncbi:MAG: branched-chain amino acid ABC transporter substrate-binding protein [Woeseiaceae bacterium]|nr:branched-chain amino acid ABC transporter substrate-binding protein [Woeseiaceae bacterium]